MFRSNRKRRGFMPLVEVLESRDLLSAAPPSLPFTTVSLNNTTKTVVIRGTDANETVTASSVVKNNGSKMTKIIYTNEDTGARVVQSYNAAAVRSIEFTAAGGDDVFDNSSGKASTVHGGDGDDVLRGSSARDVFYGEAGADVLKGFDGNDDLHGGDHRDEIHGGAGNDTLNGDGAADSIEGGAGNDKINGGQGDDFLQGYEGNDKIHGGEGNDVLMGNDGNDTLRGDDGDDELNGQAGTDSLYGGNGRDILVAIDGALADFCDGGADADISWVDDIYPLPPELTVTTAGDIVQRVTAFANGADRSLNGDIITGPSASWVEYDFSGDYSWTTHPYATFAGNPLFGSNGPEMKDIVQGQLGDCWLMSALGAIADDHCDLIRQNVVDFHDGTYAVRLANSFYRVDNQLPVAVAGATSPVFARLGGDNCMWAAVMEKAYAHYRGGANSYVNLEGGTADKVYEAFRATSTGARDFITYGTATAMATDIDSHHQGHQAVTVAIHITPPPGVPLEGDHVYMVDSVTRTAGVVTSITLRNPWGYDGGDSTDSDIYDGLVTVTPEQLFACVLGTVRWANF